MRKMEQMNTESDIQRSVTLTGVMIASASPTAAALLSVILTLVLADPVLAGNKRKKMRFFVPNKTTRTATLDKRTADSYGIKTATDCLSH